MSVPTVNLGAYKMPVVGLGTWEATNQQELESALDTALEIGYRHIDTAYSYGNEAGIGKVLKKWFSSGKLSRNDIFITTKLPLDAIHPDRVENSIKKSLENLQLEYVDLYLIHFAVCTKPRPPNSTDPIETEPTDHIAVWKKMEEQVAAGRAKTIGLSNFNIRQIDRVLKAAKIKPTCLQIESHVYMPQNELVKFAQDNGLVVVAYSPLGSPGLRKIMERDGLTPKEIPSVLIDPSVKNIAEKHKKSSAQVLLRFLIQRNIVIIPKSVTASRLRDNINLFDFKLDVGDMAVLKGLEIGESARIFDFCFAPALAKHPEWPFGSSN